MPSTLRCIEWQLFVSDIILKYHQQRSIQKLDGILPNGPYPPCLRRADRALLAGYPRTASSICQGYRGGTVINMYWWRCILHVLPTYIELTHWGRDKMAAFSQTTLSSAFSWMKILEFRLNIHWSLFFKGLINNIPALVLIMAWLRPGDKPLSEPMLVRSLTRIYVTRLQWVSRKRQISFWK